MSTPNCAFLTYSGLCKFNSYRSCGVLKIYYPDTSIMRNAANVLGLFPTDFCDSYKLIHTAINVTDHNENTYRSGGLSVSKKQRAGSSTYNSVGFQPNEINYPKEKSAGSTT